MQGPAAPDAVTATCCSVRVGPGRQVAASYPTQVRTEAEVRPGAGPTDSPAAIRASPTAAVAVVRSVVDGWTGESPWPWCAARRIHTACRCFGRTGSCSSGQTCGGRWCPCVLCVAATSEAFDSDGLRTWSAVVPLSGSIGPPHSGRPPVMPGRTSGTSLADVRGVGLRQTEESTAAAPAALLSTAWRTAWSVAEKCRPVAWGAWVAMSRAACREIPGRPMSPTSAVRHVRRRRAQPPAGRCEGQRLEGGEKHGRQRSLRTAPQGSEEAAVRGVRVHVRRRSAPWRRSRAPDPTLRSGVPDPPLRSRGAGRRDDRAPFVGGEDGAGPPRPCGRRIGRSDPRLGLPGGDTS